MINRLITYLKATVIKGKNRGIKLAKDIINSNLKQKKVLIRCFTVCDKDGKGGSQTFLPGQYIHQGTTYRIST